MQGFRKRISFAAISFILVGFVSSCITHIPRLPSHFYSQSSEDNLKEDEKSLEIESFVCQKEGRGCWEFSECRSFCEELFFNPDDRQKCHQWPISLFDDFKSLVATIKTEPFQNIEPEVLGCFIQLSEDRKTILFRQFNEEEAQEFLEEVARNPKLAFHLGREDKGDFSILHSLLKKIRGRTGKAFKEIINTKRVNFLILLHRNQNRPAWVWLNDYAVHRCRRDSFCKEPLEYYCEVLEDTFSETLADFFENQNFKNEYKTAIESKRCGSGYCEYGEVQDFREMCGDL